MIKHLGGGGQQPEPEHQRNQQNSTGKDFHKSALYRFQKSKRAGWGNFEKSFDGSSHRSNTGNADDFARGSRLVAGLRIFTEADSAQRAASGDRTRFEQLNDGEISL